VHGVEVGLDALEGDDEALPQVLDLVQLTSLLRVEVVPVMYSVDSTAPEPEMKNRMSSDRMILRFMPLAGLPVKECCLFRYAPSKDEQKDI